MADFDFMNAPDYGAPGGVRANDAFRKNALDAQETLGKIAMQPGQMRLTDAHARLYEAEASAKEAAAIAERRMADIALRAAGGQTAEAEGPTKTPRSLGSPLVDMAQMAFGAGLWKQGADLTKKAVDINAKEAAAGASQASQQLRAVRAQVAQAGEQASLALSAVDQGSYDRLRMTLAARGQDISALPEDYASAKPMLQQVVTAGMTAKDSLALAEKRIQDAAERKKWGAQAGAATATAKAAEARAKLITQTYDERAKNGGKDSPSVVALREARTKAIKDNAAAKERAEAAKDLAKFPPAPADPKARTLDKTYTWPDGSKILWTINPATGKPGARQIRPPGVKAPPEVDDTEDDLDEDD